MLFYSNGDKYDGDFINELPDGKGIYDYHEGHKYMPDKNDKDEYINNFKSGKKEGRGNEKLTCRNYQLHKW